MNLIPFSKFDPDKYLQETLMVFGNGAPYGQVVFLAGGGGSGKGFVLKNFMEGNKFKVFDVDELKQLFLQLARSGKATDSHFAAELDKIKDFNLKNPLDVGDLHQWTKDYRTASQRDLPGKPTNINNLRIASVLRPGMKTLPNIVLDTTFKDLDDVDKWLPKLKELGYKAENIHLVWVLQDYSIAIQQNRGRDRVVPEDILLQTHEGAAATMWKVIQHGLPHGMNGAVYVVLAHPKNTIIFKDKEGHPLPSTVSQIFKEKVMKIQDFMYLKLKFAGKGWNSEADVQRQLAQYIGLGGVNIGYELQQTVSKSAPMTAKTADIHFPDRVARRR